MKNILLATILLSTIACNGSGGGGPKVDVGPEKTTFTYILFDDVIDTDLNPCGFGETRYEDDNTIAICNTKNENRPIEEHYSDWSCESTLEKNCVDKLENRPWTRTTYYSNSISCTSINTKDELKMCRKLGEVSIGSLFTNDTTFIYNNEELHAPYNIGHKSITFVNESISVVYDITGYNPTPSERGLAGERGSYAPWQLIETENSTNFKVGETNHEMTL